MSNNTKTAEEILLQQLKDDTEEKRKRGIIVLSPPDSEIVQNDFFKLHVKAMEAYADQYRTEATPQHFIANGIAIKWLKRIANPMQYLREEAEKEGGTLNGYAATLCKDGNWLQDLAQRGLNEIDQSNKKGEQ